MAFFICLAVVVLTALVVIGYSISKKKNTGSERSRTFLALALFSTCVLYIPWFMYSWNTEPDEFRNKLLFIPFMIVRLMQTVSLDADYETALEIAKLADQSGAPIGFLRAYAIILSYVSVTVPLAGLVTVMSFFANQIGYWQASRTLYWRNNVYIFSGVSDRSIDLAVSIWEKEEDRRKDSVFLFCNVDKEPGVAVKNKLRRIHGWYTAEYPAMLMKLLRNKKKQIRYFLLEDENANFNDAISILKVAEKMSKQGSWQKDAKRVMIDLLLQSDELDNIIDAQNKYGIFVRILDAERMYAQDLFARWPLFSCLDSGGGRIDLLILGEGRVAEDVLMIAVWMGQIASASLGICYIGSDAELLENKLKMTCPALFDPEKAGGEEYSISFTQIDEDGKQNLQNLDVLDANYVVIAGADDERNIQTAMWYRTWIARRIPDDTAQPFIAVCVQDARRADQAEQLCIQESENSYDFHVFGTDKRVFSARNKLYDRLMHSLYEIQVSYLLPSPDAEATEEMKEEAWTQLNQSIYNYRSSEASALYIVNRLYDAGVLEECMDGKGPHSGSEQARFWMETLYKSEVENDPSGLKMILEAYDRKIKDKETEDLLSKCEHRRWNAYMASIGWVTMSEECMIEYMRTHNKAHKDYLRLQHPCIVPWDKLDSVSNIKTDNKDTDKFKRNDRNIVVGLGKFV